MYNIVADLGEAPSLADEPSGVSSVRPDAAARSRRGIRSLNIGVIASEFPPDHGGMQEHARGLVDCLAADHRISVFTSPGRSLDMFDRNVVMKPVMRWRMSHDLPELERQPMDAWITLNAGLAPYSLGLSAPLFAYVHGNDFTRPWLPLPDRPVRLARRICGDRFVQGWRTRQISSGLRAARWMFANSAFSRDLCAHLYGLPGERISVVPPGMREEFFGNGHPGASDRLRLVTVSRLTRNAERKNISGVLEAIALLKGELAVSYTVIGDGDDLARLREMAVSLGISGDVCFLGSVETSAIIEEFGRSDAFIMAVQPSETDVEGFGMVYAEAAAGGLPSIGTRTGGISEAIEHGVTGMLLDDVSAQGIADGLRAFRRCQTNFDRNVIQARTRRFSNAACTAMITDVIRAMI